MINFNPNDPDVRHLEFRSNIQAHESLIRKALRTGAFDTFYALLDQHLLDHEQIEGCLMLVMVSYGRKTSNNEKLIECANALVARLTRPITLIELLTYGRVSSHLTLVRKFIPHCSASAATIGMLTASEENNQQLFDLLYPHSNLEKAQQIAEFLTGAQRILFDERMAHENLCSVLKQTVAVHGGQRGDRKL